MCGTELEKIAGSFAAIAGWTFEKWSTNLPVLLCGVGVTALREVKTNVHSGATAIVSKGGHDDEASKRAKDLNVRSIVDNQ